MEKKRDKKKLLVLGLLLFAVVGLAGYGVYSYYYTEGTMSTEEPSDDSDNVIHITGEFNPKVYQSSGIDDFLGNGGTINLTCPSKAGMNEKITCEATVEVKNDGTTPIRVKYSDVSSGASSEDGIDVYAGNPSISWSNPDHNVYDEGYGDSDGSFKTIEAGSSEYIDIEVEVSVGSSNSNSISNDEPQLVTAPVSAGSLNAYASFRLEAKQVRN